MLFSISESKKQEGQVKEKIRNIIQLFLRASADSKNIIYGEGRREEWFFWICICLSRRFWVLGLTRIRVLSILVLIFYWWISSSHCIRLCFSILSEIVSGACLHLWFHEIYEHLFCFKKLRLICISKRMRTKMRMLLSNLFHLIYLFVTWAYSYYTETYRT